MGYNLGADVCGGPWGGIKFIILKKN